MQESGKCNLKISIIPNGLEKYMSFIQKFDKNKLDLVKQKGFYNHK